MARKLKPNTVVKRWEKYCEEYKEKHGKKPGSYHARRHAKLAGMRSMGEVYCAADMDKRGISYRYEPFKLQYTIEGEYTPDWACDKDVVVEYKGKMTDQVRKKLVAIKNANPDIRLCLVFERAANKLTSRKNSWTYGEWAEKNGFEWSDKTVKEEWFK